MTPRPDISVHSPDRTLQLVVEVKSRPGASSEWAAKFRRNLLANGAVPNAPYLIIASPQRLYLWRKGPNTEVPPDFSAGTQEVLKEYLGKLAEQSPHLTEESLQIALISWLRDLTFRRPPRQDSDAERILVESGAYEAIRDGAVTSDAHR